MLSGFSSNSVTTKKGYVNVNLEVGPIKSPTRFHVIDAETSYHILLGRPWLHTHSCVPSTLHLCLKSRWKNKDIEIPASRTPGDPNEAHIAEAVFFDELSEEGESALARPIGVPLPKWEDIAGKEDKYPKRGKQGRKKGGEKDSPEWEKGLP